MRSASNFWIFILLSSLFFNCATLKHEADDISPTQKAYILLRTEGNEKEINRLTSILNSDFVTNKITSNIIHYPLGMAWNNNQIFSTAYDNNFDYIILIDQIAKFTIDNQTQVGGKYQIRSYPIKSSNPDWIDLGQKTCNISVKLSVQKFSQQIISEILPNYITSKVNIHDGELYAEKQQSPFPEIDYNQLKSSEEIDFKIEELRRQLEIEKEKTKKTIAERERLEEEYGMVLSSQKKKNRVILEELENLKKEKELAEFKRTEELRSEENKKKEEQENLAKAKDIERKRLGEERIAEAKRMEESRLKEIEKKAQEEKLAEAENIEEKRIEEDKLAEAIREEENKLKKLEKRAHEEELAEAKRMEEKRIEEDKLAEAKREEEIKLKEFEKKEKEEKRLAEAIALEEVKQNRKASSNKKNKNSNQNVLTEKSNALIIIRGSEEDSAGLKKLKDNLEFELLFANIKATTEVYSKEMTLNKQDVLKFNKLNYRYLILIDQLEENDEGPAKYNISVVSSSYGNDWYNLDDQFFDLNDKNSLKQFSKTVLKLL